MSYRYLTEEEVALAVISGTYHQVHRPCGTVLYVLDKYKSGYVFWRETRYLIVKHKPSYSPTCRVCKQPVYWFGDGRYIVDERGG